jgi:hypothetical protein
MYNMSNSFQPIQPVLVRDPRTMISNPREYAVLQGGSKINWKYWQTSNVSNSAFNFTTVPPAPNIYVDRKQYLYATMRFTFTGTPPVGQTLIQPNRDALRAYPLLSAMDSLKVIINGFSVSVDMSDVIHPFSRFNINNDDRETVFSLSPTYPDQSQQYSDLFDSIRSPLQSYGDSLEGVEPRGAYPFVIISNPVSTGVPVTAVVDAACLDAIMLSPFFWGQGNSTGFINVSSMDFNITWLGAAAYRMWSHDSQGGTNIITSASVVFGGQPGGPTTTFPMGNIPLIITQYITPQETQIVSPIEPITYSYFLVNRYTTNLGLIAQGAPLSPITSNTIQLSSIPKRIYAYIRPANSALYADCSLTDTYFQIQSVSIQFQNDSGLLASANMSQLYTLAVKNHCKMSWNQWSGGLSGTLGLNTPGTLDNNLFTVGSIICLEPGIDLGLNALQAPGQTGLFTLQITLNALPLFTLNPTAYPSGTINCQMTIIIVEEGTFTIQGVGRATANIGVLSSKDVLDAQSSPAVNYSDVEQVNGGDFLSGLKDFGQSLLSGLKNFVSNKGISSSLGSIPHPYAQVGSQVAKALGLGEGVYAGGKLMNRRDLRSRLKNY